MRFALPVLFLLSACDNAAERAEEQYRIVSDQQFATKRDKCRAARKAADAWLERGNAEKYDDWMLTVSIYC